MSVIKKERGYWLVEQSRKNMALWIYDRASMTHACKFPRPLCPSTAPISTSKMKTGSPLGSSFSRPSPAKIGLSIHTTRTLPLQPASLSFSLLHLDEKKDTHKSSVDAVLRKASSFIDDTPTPLVCWSASIIYVDWLCTRPYDPFTDEEVHNELYADQVDEEKKERTQLGAHLNHPSSPYTLRWLYYLSFFFCRSLSSYFFFPFLGILFLLSVSILSKFYSRGDMQITSAEMQRNAPFPFRFCKEEQRDDIGSTGNSSLIHSSSAKFNEWFTTLKDLQEKELTFYN